MVDDTNHERKLSSNLSGFQDGLNGTAGPSELFFELTRQLKTRFNISKGVFLLRSGIDAPLAAISTWDNGQTRHGLAIKLPSEESLFERVARQGQVYTDNFCDSFSGNFFERKLLLNDSSKSFVLHPVKCNGEVIGLLGYSSSEPTAFTMFEEGAVEDIVADFGQVVRDRVLSR
ncbi:MAG: GAF domain-containing protein [Candidatus Zixiibacteriota bacterium]|nr:MAG: GAF domain-containing protein [candidate division Zixibacteria bacterium]